MIARCDNDALFIYFIYFVNVIVWNYNVMYDNLTMLFNVNDGNQIFLVVFTRNNYLLN